MRAVIQIFGEKASIQDWKWTCRNMTIESLLNHMLAPLGPSGADPAPNYHEAQRIAEMFRGKVLEYELPEFIDGTIY